ncbi:MAG: hypothetical protein JKX81_08670 [Arenicella sp.]|nr:hypothetical protein [Arenicella sp.]
MSNSIVHMSQSTWQDGLDSLYGGKVISLNEETYWHFLGCVPPLAQEQLGFVCGEPYSHNSDGEGIYLTAFEIRDKYYAKHRTLKEFKFHKTFGAIMTAIEETNNSES